MSRPDHGSRACSCLGPHRSTVAQGLADRAPVQVPGFRQAVPGGSPRPPPRGCRGTLREGRSRSPGGEPRPGRITGPAPAGRTWWSRRRSPPPARTPSSAARSRPAAGSSCRSRRRRSRRPPGSPCGPGCPASWRSPAAPSPRRSEDRRSRQSGSGRSAGSTPEAARSAGCWSPPEPAGPSRARATSRVVVPPSSKTVSPSSTSAAVARPMACFWAVAVCRPVLERRHRANLARVDRPAVRPLHRSRQVKSLEVAPDRALRDPQRP